MTQIKIYPKGLRTFPKNEKQPEFVLGSLVITPNELVSWLRENESLLTDYKGEKQLRLQMLNGNKGIYFVVDTYSKDKELTKNDNLPF